MKSSNLAIVFVDIVGFTERTSRQSRDESEAWLRRYEELLLPLVKAFGGRKVKEIGDAYLLTFASPTNALLFGMAAQDRLYEYNKSARESERIEIRVACNVGEVRQRRGDVFGEPVNIAARLEGLTPTGAIWFTEAVHLAMTRSEVPSEEVGEKKLKGVKHPVRVYRVPEGPVYLLSGRQDAQNEQDEAHSSGAEKEILQYPYGGIGLKRAAEHGWAMSLAGVTGKLTAAGGRAARSADALSRRIRAVSKKTWIGMAGVALVVVLGVLLWPAGTYGDVEDALEAGHPGRALALLNKHAEKDEPRGQVLRARALLMEGNKADVNRAENLLKEAIGKDPSLLSDERVIRDLVGCLNRRNAKETMDFIEHKLGSAAVGMLVKASANKRYWLRWNSISLLEKMGELDEVDMPLAYIQDLRFGGSCSTRKRAAKKLAELKDRRALEYLRKAKQRGFMMNLCMGDTLDEAIETIEND